MDAAGTAGAKALAQATKHVHQARENQQAIQQTLRHHLSSDDLQTLLAEVDIYMATDPATVATVADALERYTFTYPGEEGYRRGDRRLPHSHAYMSPTTHLLSTVVPFVATGRILCVATSTAYAELLLQQHTTSTVTLCLLRPLFLDPVHALQRRYPGRLEVFVIGHNVSAFQLRLLRRVLPRTARFDTLVLDFGTRHLPLERVAHGALALVLAADYLVERGSLVLANAMPTPQDKAVCRGLNDVVRCFRYFVLHPSGFDSRFRSGDIFCHFDPAAVDRDRLAAARETLLTLYTQGPPKTSAPAAYSALFVRYMVEKWRAIAIHTTLHIQYIMDRIAATRPDVLPAIVKAEEARLSVVASTAEDEDADERAAPLFPYSVWYRRVGLQVHKARALPLTLDDLQETLTYEEPLREYQPRCHWGQKKLHLSEIQFLTEVARDLGAHTTRRFADYCAVYVGSAAGHHLELLYELFPELDWVLIDPAPYNEHARRHPRGSQAVTIINDFFTDATVDQIRPMLRGREVLFISDIRVDSEMEHIDADMKNQARWALMFNAAYSLFKFRLPYGVQATPDAPWMRRVGDFTGIERTRFSNPDLEATGPTDTLYFDGQIFLQLYPPKYSTELRLLVKRGADGRYPLKTYDFIDIENRLFFYNTVVRGSWTPTPALVAEMELDRLATLPGYDTTVEAVLELHIVRAYVRQFRVKRDPFDLMFNMSRRLERFTYRTFAQCAKDTYRKGLTKKEGDPRALAKQALWMPISDLYIAESAWLQGEYLEAQGARYWSAERVHGYRALAKSYIAKETNVPVVVTATEAKPWTPATK